MAIIVTPNNMGSTLRGAGELNKFNVKVDGTTIIVNPDGSLAAVGGGNTSAQPYVSASVSGNKLLLTRTNGNVDEVDLSNFAVDVNVTSITDNGNGVYTFHQDDGGPDVDLDLTAVLRSVQTVDTQSVSLAGAGTAVSPLSAAVRLSDVAGNTIAATAAGLYSQLETSEELVEYGTNQVLGYIRPA